MRHHRVGFSTALILHSSLVAAGLWWYQNKPGSPPEGTPVAINISQINWSQPLAANQPTTEALEETVAPPAVEPTLPTQNHESVTEASEDLVQTESVATQKTAPLEPNKPIKKNIVPQLPPVTEEAPQMQLAEKAEHSESTRTETPEEPIEPSPTPASAQKPATVEQAPSVNANVIDPEIRNEYLAALHKALQEAMRYPNRARRRRQEGTAWVEFSLHQEGTLSSIQLRESSGYPLLDEAALDTVKSLGRFEPIPPEIDKNLLTLAIPISFQLH